jgi:hypothetical protein
VDQESSDEQITLNTLTLATPGEGETLTAGSTCTISWSYTGSPGRKVMIELIKDGALDCVIDSSVSIGRGGSGSHDWVIPADQTVGSDYSIRITSTIDSRNTAASGIFTIS